MHHPVDYARVVSRIGNEMDLTLVDLDDILPAATVMVVTVRPLPPRETSRAMRWKIGAMRWKIGAEVSHE